MMMAHFQVKFFVLLFGGMAVVAPLLFGQVTECPDQEFKSWTGLSFQVDPNRIAVDPYSGQRLFLGWRYGIVGTAWIWDANACDPDGDSLMLTASKGNLLRSTGDAYRVTGAATAVGTIYVDVTATDQPGEGRTALTRKGTFVIVVLPANRPPSLCGG
jgi:hypothetical protein